MTHVKEHYDRHLGSIYAWMIGDTEAAFDRNRAFFAELGFVCETPGFAVDLGAGPGYQSIPLAELGYSVLALDFCEELLSQLRHNSKALPIRALHDDLTNFAASLDMAPDLIVCMGDTVTHLTSQHAVSKLIADIARTLADAGIVVFTFRDYVSFELKGSDRFIPVRSDANQLLSCFLEYGPDTVKVHDHLWTRHGDNWSLAVSSYSKLRLDKNWVADELQQNGLTVTCCEANSGTITVMAEKR